MSWATTGTLLSTTTLERNSVAFGFQLQHCDEIDATLLPEVDVFDDEDDMGDSAAGEARNEDLKNVEYKMISHIYISVLVIPVLVLDAVDSDLGSW